MTLQQLNYVIAIADAGSFNRAAAKLYIAQPTLTSAIKDLEQELKLSLFHRSARGAVLTPEGHDFLPYARSVISQFQNLQDVYGKEGKRKQKFAVSTQHYSFAVKAFVELTRAYDVSEYTFAIRETRTKQVIDDVASSQSDIGVLFLSDFNRKVILKLFSDNGLTFTHLIDCNAYVYLWKEHPLAKQQSISFDDLQPYPCLSFEQGDDSNFFLSEEILATNDYPRIIKCSDRATVLNLMVGLNGYTLCSGIICEELNGGDYIAIPYAPSPDNPNSVMEIGYITRKSAVTGSVGKRYVSELEHYLGIREEESYAYSNQ